MLLIQGQIKTVSYYRQITHLAVSKSSTLRVIINVLSFPACNFVWKTGKPIDPSQKRPL